MALLAHIRQARAKFGKDKHSSLVCPAS